MSYLSIAKNRELLNSYHTTRSLETVIAELKFQKITKVSQWRAADQNSYRWALRTTSETVNNKGENIEVNAYDYIVKTLKLEKKEKVIHSEESVVAFLKANDIKWTDQWTKGKFRDSYQWAQREDKISEISLECGIKKRPRYRFKPLDKKLKSSLSLVKSTKK